MNTGKAILGVLAGMAAGAVIGMLFAPDKGTETRRKIAKKGEDLMDSLEDRIDRKFDELRAIVSPGSRKQKAEGQPLNSGNPTVLN